MLRAIIGPIKVYEDRVCLLSRAPHAQWTMEYGPFGENWASASVWIVPGTLWVD